MRNGFAVLKLTNGLAVVKLACVDLHLFIGNVDQGQQYQEQYKNMGQEFRKGSFHGILK